MIRLLGALALLCLVAGEAGAAPRNVIDAIIKVESGGNPRATGKAGEIGLMQIKCATARSVGFTGKCRDLYDPRINVRYGTAYLNAALRVTRGNLDHALSLYQRGIGSKYRGCSSYCRKVKAAMR